MTEKDQIYQCLVCGNIVEIVKEGVGSLICCNQPMHLVPAKTEDEGHEKHVPLIEKTPKGAKVKVGSTLHPMEKGHYIKWIELGAGEQKIRQYLIPGVKPIIEFEIQFDLPVTKEPNLQAREYCSLHGLWQSKNDHSKE